MVLGRIQCSDLEDAVAALSRSENPADNARISTSNGNLNT